MQRQPSVQELVVSTIASGCNVNAADITRDTTLVDVGMDSLGFAMMVAYVEATYTCKLSAVQIADLMAAGTVGDVVGVIRGVVSELRSVGRIEK